MRTGRVAETARAGAGPELCDSVVQGSPVRRASLGHFYTLPRKVWASLICPYLFELPEGRDWPQSTSQVSPIEFRFLESGEITDLGCLLPFSHL